MPKTARRRSLRAVTVEPDLTARITAQSFLADPPADALVARFRALPGGAGWRMLDDALAGRSVTGAPPELAAVLAPALDPPDWVDDDLVDAGAVAWWRAGAPMQLLALTSGSLAYGYGNARLARPLAMTGRLTQMAPRRLGETSRWVMAATAPGALRPGGAGVAATVRLRLVHALVRARLRRDWDVATDGEPISVADTLATGMAGFFTVPMDAMADMGVRFTPAEREAIAHLWCRICHLMGVPEEHLLRSYPEAKAWADHALSMDPGPIAESPALLDALLFSSQKHEALPGPAAFVARQVSGHVFGAFARRWMGAERADALGAPDTPLKHAAPLLRPFNRARDMALATGLLGPDERVAAIERALVLRLMRLNGTPQAQLSPEEVEREPVLRAAA